ncbi:hypothetical protein DAPPUDRAFT_243971 [Daphnia pulex]|uniref:Uncharacterized protein n=1 Tax=Daphnia pulex TaxID=6669 RepID=E9GJX7_DAPPU|nr:hypothetical protein DAPPUDRAFT_243971 [Daphnia pulex]|eukprot:EFX80247.1 hypothetical protein DAPPUDRAFT_243971 [Daphnia pulex]
MYNKYKRLSEGVARDMEQAGATQAQFEAEVDSQIQVEEEVGDALIIVKRKREEFREIQAAEERKRQDQTLLLTFSTQQKAADAVRAQEKANQDAARAQEKADQDAARTQGRCKSTRKNRPSTRNSRSTGLVSTIDCCHASCTRSRARGSSSNYVNKTTKTSNQTVQRGTYLN